MRRGPARAPEGRRADREPRPEKHPAGARRRGRHPGGAQGPRRRTAGGPPPGAGDRGRPKTNNKSCYCSVA